MTDTFGCRLRQFRESLSLSLEEVAATLQVSPACLSAVESGDTEPLGTVLIERLSVHFSDIAVSLLCDVALREACPRTWHTASLRILGEVQALAVVLSNDILDADDLSQAQEMVRTFQGVLAAMKDGLCPRKDSDDSFNAES